MATYYVDGDIGNDANSGVSTTYPWKSISHAISKLGTAASVGAGDTIYIRERDGGAGYSPVTTAPYYDNNFTINISGTSGAQLTIKNYPNESPWIDGNYAFPTAGGKAYIAPDTNYQSYWGPLVDIIGAYVTFDGIGVRESNGRGIRVFETNNVTVKNCEVKWNFLEGIYIHESDNILIDSNDVWEAGSFTRQTWDPSQVNHPGALGVRGGNNITVQNNYVHSSFTEGILADVNYGGCSNVAIRGNIVWDCAYDMIYAHAGTNIVVERNVVFVSLTQRAQKFYSKYAPAGIIVGSQEKPGSTNYSLNGCKVVNNFILGAILDVRGYTNASTVTNPIPRMPLLNVTIANNTIVAGPSCLVPFGTRFQPSDCPNGDVTFQNNIVYGFTESARHLTLRGMTFDYNWWGVLPPTALRGAHDGGPGDPGLVDVYWGPNKNSDESITTPFLLSSNGLDAGADAADIGASLYTLFAKAPAVYAGDYWGSYRGDDWDMGAHESNGVSTGLTVIIEASVTEGNAPLEVDFMGTASGGLGNYTYYWEFGTGETSILQNPTGIIFADKGVYTVKLTAVDPFSDEEMSGTATETITVYTQPPVSEGQVTVEQVIFNAGAASYAVSDQPKAIIFMYGGGISDGTAASNSQFGMGIYVASSGDQYALGTVAQDGVGTTGVAENLVSTGAVLFMTPIETTLALGTVTSVSDSAVNLSWSGTTSSEKIVSWNFYGSDVTNAAIKTIYLGAAGSTASVTGDYSFMVMPAILRTVDKPFGLVDASIGFATIGGDQMCYGWSNRDALGTSDIYSIIKTDRVAYRPYGARVVEITSWSAASIAFKLWYADVNATVPMLVMKISNADVHIGVENTPTATGVTAYTSAGFDAQVALGILTNLTAVDTVASDSTAGVGGFVVVDDGGTDRTIIKSSKDAATGSMVEKAYTDAQYALLDEIGTVIDEGAASIITNGWQLNLTTAGGTARKRLDLLIEETSTQSGPDAWFTYTNDGTDVPNYYGDGIVFTDLSWGDGTYDIVAWDWDWGDGTAHGTTQNATHTFASDGTYPVTLTVTDNNPTPASNSETRDVEISVPEQLVVVNISPSSGPIPLTVTLDASESDPGGDEEWDEDRTLWSLISLYKWRGGDADYIANGITTTVEIDKPGSYFVYCTMWTKSDIENGYTPSVPDIIAYIDPELNFESQHGKVAITGPYTAEFEAFSNRGGMDSAWIAWDFGDGQTEEATGLTEVDHVYVKQMYVDFNGSSSKVVCGSDDTLDDLHDGAMTVEAWIRADDWGESSQGMIAYKGGLNSTGWHFRVGSAVGLYARVECATTPGLASSGLEEFSADGEWHHVAMTWDDASYNYPRLWIDGVEPGYGTTQNRVDAIVSDLTSNFMIGNISSDTRSWDGGIAWVRLSDTVRYTTSFTPPSKGAPPEADANTVEQWNLNDETGTTAAALVNTPTNDGTITAGVWEEIQESFSYDVSLTVSFPEDDFSVEKDEYITIVPEQDPPNTIPELIARVQALQSMIDEAKRHMGCLEDATWVQDGTYTNVYTATVEREWAVGYGYIVKENGSNLSALTSISACNGTAGSFYVNYNNPNLEVSVHATGSDDPTTNGNTYSLRFLTYNIHVREPIAIGDSSLAHLLSINVVDSVTVGDSATMFNELYINAVDAIDISESATTFNGYYINVAESVDVDESAGASVS